MVSCLPYDIRSWEYKTNADFAINFETGKDSFQFYLNLQI